MSATTTKTRTRKPAASKPAPAVDPAVVAAAAYTALAKVGGKEANRDDLAAGATHAVRLAIAGQIDGEEFETYIAADLSVGHDSTRASSTGPKQGELIAVILGKLNTATRDKILRELPEEFAANDNQLPAVDTTAVDAVDSMLKRLRAKKTQNVRGSVSCSYRLGVGE